MPVVAKIDPIDKDIDVILRQDLSPEARSASLASFARLVLDEAQDINLLALGRVPLHETFVDGRPGANEDSVRPDGEITYAFKILEDLFDWIAEQLVAHSPVGKTGRYARSHAFYADGVEVPLGAIAPDAAEWVFINTLPYARKIERGLSPQAPEGVYQAVAVLASRRFGNVARVSYAFRTVSGGERNPAIVIRLR